MVAGHHVLSCGEVNQHEIHFRDISPRRSTLRSGKS